MSFLIHAVDYYVDSSSRSADNFPSRLTRSSALEVKSRPHTSSTAVIHNASVWIPQLRDSNMRCEHTWKS